jgi:hypothetical protein
VLIHRQFGVLVTTSFVAAQADMRQGGHRVIIVAADLARLLIDSRLNSVVAAESRLLERFPLTFPTGE